MSFPVTKRYFLHFRQQDTGLLTSGFPAFLFYNNAQTFAPISQPTIFEVNGTGLGAGSYYFDVTYATSSDPQVVFNVDGGASIPTEEIRYISDNIGPSDCFLDEPVSQVVTDVWSNNTVYSSGQKGFEVDTLPTIASGVAGLVSSVATLTADIARMLGLSHENAVMDQTTFDGNNNLLSARIRLYDNPTDAAAAGSTGVIASYGITASYLGINLQTYIVVRTS